MSTTVPLRSQAGMVVGEVSLEPGLFDTQVNVPAMHQVVVAQMAAWRSGTHKTKTRGEVSGGGRKPYRQKGTGRARQGSIRAPHYRGGGIVFGPVVRSHAKKVNKKTRALALRSALTDRARDGKVAVIESIAFEVPKTKEALALLADVGLGEGKVLVVIEARDGAIERSFRNIEHVHVISVDQLNTYDILARDWVLFTKAALERLQARAANGPKAAETPTETPAATQAATGTEGGESA